MKKVSKSMPCNLSTFAVDSRSATGCVIPPPTLFGQPLSPARNLTIPFNLDAEFVDNLARSGPFELDLLRERSGVTVQIRGVAEDTGLIFAHPDQAELAESTGRELRHPVIDSPCVVQDWLNARGVDCEIYPDPERFASLKKTCRLQVLAHFALADVMFLAGDGQFAETLANLYSTRRLQMGRRLIAKASGHAQSRSGSTALAPYVIRFGDVHYRLALEIVDTIGLHGNASYAELAANVGFPLDAKDTISRKGPNADIARMDEIYWERPDDFDAYALGDLHVSDVIYRNERLWGQIWDSLGIEHRFTCPKLTIGSTVADLLRSRIAEELGIAEGDDDLISNTTGTHNAGTLARLAKNKNPLSLLSKVDGGRCRNAKPTTIRMEGALVDIDIGGAYASAMTATPLAFGKARECSYGNARDLAADLTKCPNLSEWLRRHGHQLVDRAWFARVSTREPFSFESDLIPSWIGYRVTTARSDSENVGLDVLTDPASGEMRYFGHEIWSGTLTSDLLDVARNTMSPGQFAEWSNKIVVRSALYFDEKDRITVAQYRRHLKNGTLPEFAWASMTLGELVSDVARANRMEHAKNSPLNILFKLVSNTLYGDSVSRHFATSSVISGSNVTGTVRAFMFLAEKGLNLVGSITDGQLFDLNRVLHAKPDNRMKRVEPGSRSLDTRAYRLSRRDLKEQGCAKFAPLIGKSIKTGFVENDLENIEHKVKRPTGEYETIRGIDAVREAVGTDKFKTLAAMWPLQLTIEHLNGDVEIVRGVSTLQRVDDAAFAHLVKLWPRCKLLADTFRVVAGLNDDRSVKYHDQRGIFRFETKQFVSRAALHGSANYWHKPLDPSRSGYPKMRSFEGGREHYGFSLDDQGELAFLETYVGQSPAHVLLGAILTDPAHVPILPPFTKTRILKPGIYSPKPVNGRRSTSRYQTPGVTIVPGDSIFVIGRPRIFSIAQFTFKTRTQYAAWNRATTRLVNRYGISFEQFFTNPDGVTVDYQTMVNEIDNAIVAGVIDPVAHFVKTRKRVISEVVKQYHAASIAMAAHLNGRLGADDTEYESYDPSETAGFEGREFA